MKHPRWWLSLITRAERLSSIAGAVSVAWLYAVYELSSDHWRKVSALTCIIVLGFAAGVLATTTHVWKLLLTEMIEETESEKDWKKIRESRWPSG